MLGEVSSSRFYGSHGKTPTTSPRTSNKQVNVIQPFKPKNLLSGPCTIWKVFTKQADAIEFLRKKNDGLMTFAFETHKNTRQFLVAHPEVFWHYDCQRPASDRNTYEIIQEYAACKLYFDLEFEYEFNPSKNGGAMVACLLDLIIHLLNSQFKINASLPHALILDSTTKVKFSNHVIFNIPRFYFQNNYQAGNFVKFLTFNILESISSGKVVGCLEGSGRSLEDIQSLFVSDSKGNQGLFVDEGVYTKNRHFRLFKSTKKGKNSPLEYSSQNTHSYPGNDLELFLSSLISYVKENPDSLTLGEFGEKSPNKSTDLCKVPVESCRMVPSSSPYPKVDEFIKKLLSPCQIYRTGFFPSSSVLVYDIIGNKFCHNIGRPHKKNHVKYIVDLKALNYYQKCYDYDCAGFKSTKWRLPDELAFLLSDDDDFIDDLCTVPEGLFEPIDSELENIVDEIEQAALLEL